MNLLGPAGTIHCNMKAYGFMSVVSGSGAGIAFMVMSCFEPLRQSGQTRRRSQRALSTQGLRHDCEGGQRLLYWRFACHGDAVSHALLGLEPGLLVQGLKKDGRRGKRVSSGASVT